MSLVATLEGDGGFKALDSWLAEVPLSASAAAESALHEIGRWVFKESQQLVPVDKGVLKASGGLNFVGKGFDALAVINYGVYYAIYVHEDVGKYHPNGQAKFVENPLRRAQAFASQWVAGRVATSLRGPSF